MWQVVGSARTPRREIVHPDSDGHQCTGSSRQVGKQHQVGDAALTDTTPAANVVHILTGGTGQIVLATFTDGNPYAESSDFNVDVNPDGNSGVPWLRSARPRCPVQTGARRKQANRLGKCVCWRTPPLSRQEPIR